MSTKIFKPLSADDTDMLSTEIESLCVSCEKNGVTRLLLTKIPFYKEVILMSFSCENCGYKNNEIQSGTKVQEQGIRYVVKIETPKDLNREVVKSNYASIRIPEADFEIPFNTQAGEVTTVEGILSRAAENLRHSQDYRKATNSTQADLVDKFLENFEKLLTLEKPFTFIIDDPSGDSFVENPNPCQVDGNTTIIHYYRTLQQDKMLALVADDVKEDNSEETQPAWESREAIRNEVLHFGVNCSNCGAPTQTNMKLVNIPYFKEVVIMATSCDKCGVRTSEVKSGSGISDMGIRLTLRLVDSHDLTRDVLKSETCSLRIPELDIEIGMGVLGGRFTTVEGLLTSIKEDLIQNGGFVLGDSAEESKREAMNRFLAKLEDVISLKPPVTIILDDPAGNSYIQSFSTPNADDRLKVECYERTFEQNEDLGLNDMKTENYEQK